MVKTIRDKIILRPNQIKPTSNLFKVIGVLNPGAARLKNKKIVLYVRVIEQLKKFKDSKYYYSPRYTGKNKFKIKIDRFPKNQIIGDDNFGFEFKNETKRLSYISHLRRVILDKDGFSILHTDKKPSFFGLKNDSELGIEDPRITKIDDEYYMTYVGLSIKEGISTYLAASNDCKAWKRLGIIFGQQDKDVVLFPEKINGKYVAFDRPEGNFRFSPPHIGIAFSKDLIHWGNLKSIDLHSKKIELSRSGSGPPPINISRGFLFLLHAVTRIKTRGFIIDLKRKLGMKVEEGPSVYATWAALFNKQNPLKLISHSHVPILIPKKKHEISFEGKKVIFPTGLIFDENKKDLLVYSGAGDIYVTAKKIKLKDILKTLKNV